MEASQAGASAGDKRDQAVASIKRKQAFKQSLAAYVIVNAFLVLIWALSDGGSFWPGWVMGAWGLGLCFQAWDAYGRRHGISEDDVQREMQKLR
jgi:hypothetical protein